jgi:hypothetical protein
MFLLLDANKSSSCSLMRRESLQFFLFEFVLLIEERLALRELTKKKHIGRTIA